MQVLAKDVKPGMHLFNSEINIVLKVEYVHQLETNPPKIKIHHEANLSIHYLESDILECVNKRIKASDLQPGMMIVDDVLGRVETVETVMVNGRTTKLSFEDFDTEISSMDTFWLVENSTPNANDSCESVNESWEDWKRIGQLLDVSPDVIVIEFVSQCTISQRKEFSIDFWLELEEFGKLPNNWAICIYKDAKKS
jgi:hypothetical protein